MGTKDPRVDAYINDSATFAKPILRHLRSLVHKACPDVVETIKWSFPNFVYKGILCSMASFKQHCSFGFWKASLMSASSEFGKDGKTGMGHLGQIKSLSDLPSDKLLLSYIKEAAKLNDDGAKAAKLKSKAKPQIKVPADFAAALNTNKKARSVFDGFSPSQRREYIEWITEAKTTATREKRLAMAVEWISEGKIRNWKYVRK